MQGILKRPRAPVNPKLCVFLSVCLLWSKEINLANSKDIFCLCGGGVGWARFHHFRKMTGGGWKSEPHFSAGCPQTIKFPQVSSCYTIVLFTLSCYFQTCQLIRDSSSSSLEPASLIGLCSFPSFPWIRRSERQVGGGRVKRGGTEWRKGQTVWTPTLESIAFVCNDSSLCWIWRHQE